MMDFGPACGYQGDHYHEPGIDPDCLDCTEDTEDAQSDAAARVKQADTVNE